MNNVNIIAALYDSAGKVIGTDFTYTNVDTLRPGEKSSFKIILNDADQSQKVDSYKLSVLGDKAEALPVALKLHVDDSSVDDNRGTYNVVGKVTNQASQKATFVKVSGAFCNSSNTIIGTRTDSTI